MPAVRLQLIALLAAVAVLFSSGASANTQYLCRFTGVLRSDCCCAVVGPSLQARQAQQARAADCCERLVTAARSGATGTRDQVPGASSMSGAHVLAVLPAHASSPPPAANVVARAMRALRDPPAVGPPLFVAHCSLLI